MSVIVALLLTGIALLFAVCAGGLLEAKKEGSAAVGLVVAIVLHLCALWAIA